MAINKIIDRNGNTLLDLTADDIGANTNSVLKGLKYHGNDGNIYTGTLEPGITTKRFIFKDHTGSIIAAYNDEELQSLTELPTPPEHTGLTFQEWNWSLEGLKNLQDSNIHYIHANYITTDNKVHIYMDNGANGETINLNINARDGSNNWLASKNINFNIDWGDGTIESVNSYGITHTFVKDSEEIIISIEDDNPNYLISLSQIGTRWISKILTSYPVTICDNYSRYGRPFICNIPKTEIIAFISSNAKENFTSKGAFLSFNTNSYIYSDNLSVCFGENNTISGNTNAISFYFGSWSERAISYYNFETVNYELTSFKLYGRENYYIPKNIKTLTTHNYYGKVKGELIDLSNHLNLESVSITGQNDCTYYGFILPPTVKTLSIDSNIILTGVFDISNANIKFSIGTSSKYRYLKKVIIRDTENVLDIDYCIDGTAGGTSFRGKIYVPSNLISEYKSHTWWSKNADKIYSLEEL